MKKNVLVALWVIGQTCLCPITPLCAQTDTLLAESQTTIPGVAFNTLMEQRSLKFLLPTIGRDTACQIYGYVISVIDPGKDTVAYAVRNDRFPTSFLGQLNDLPSKKTVQLLFSNIVARCPHDEGAQLMADMLFEFTGASYKAQIDGDERDGEPYPLVISSPGVISLWPPGMVSHFALLAEGIPAGEIQVLLTNDGKVTHLGENRYAATASKPGDAFLEFYYHDLLIGKRRCTVPAKFVDWSSYKGDYAAFALTKDSLLRNPSVQAWVKDLLPNEECVVQRYKATLLPMNKEYTVIDAASGTLDADILAQIEAMPPGKSAVLFLDRIQVVYKPFADTYHIELGGVAIKIHN